MKLFRCRNWEWYYDYPCATTTAEPDFSGDFWDTSTSPGVELTIQSSQTTSELSEVTSKIWTSTRLTTEDITSTTTNFQPLTSMTKTTVGFAKAQTKVFNFWPTVIITVACNLVFIIFLILIYKVWSRPKRYHIVKLDDENETLELQKRIPKRSRANRDSIVNDSRIYPGDSAL